MRQGMLLKAAVILALIFAANLFNVNNTGAEDKGKTYKIGELRNMEAIVFYDKGSYSDGWRYLEVNLLDLEKIKQIQTNSRGVRNGIKWGCSKSIPVARNAGIGTGKINTQAILDACGYDSDSSIATDVIDFQYPGRRKRRNNSSTGSMEERKKKPGRDDSSRLKSFKIINEWFIPSKDELNLIYVNLVKNNPKDSYLKEESKNTIYWSSTEDSEKFAWCQDFRNGAQAVGIKYTVGKEGYNFFRSALMIRAF